MTGRNDYVAAAEVGAGKTHFRDTSSGNELKTQRLNSGRVDRFRHSIRPEQTLPSPRALRHLPARVRAVAVMLGVCRQVAPIGVPSARLIHKNRYWKFGSERHGITSPYTEARRNCGLRQVARKKSYLCREGERKLRPTDTSRMARARSLASRRFVT